MGERIRNDVATISTTSVLISEEVGLDQVGVRAYTNTSTSGQIITLSFNSEAVAGAGIVLSAGAFWSESLDARFQPTPRRLFAVASASGATLAIHERYVMG